MTEKATGRQILFIICSFFAIFLGLRYSELCAEGIKRGIELSVNKLIPSLFPSMVIAEVMINGGACETLAKRIAKPFSHIFKISSEGALPFLLGMLFGFPIGVKSAVTLYERGDIDKRELWRLSIFTSIPSPAFFISAVGEGLFGSAPFGIMLYLCALTTAIAVGIASRFLFTDGEGEYFCVRRTILEERKSFTEAVSSSAETLISISAFVVFFSAIGRVLEEFFEHIALNETASTLILGSLEMTSGATSAATLGEKGAPLAAAILGFSGISVLCQFISAFGKHKAPILPYLLSKLVFASTLFLCSSIALHFFGNTIGITSPSAPSFLLYQETDLSTALFALFLCACFIALNRRKRSFFEKTIYKR
ncbi:MAG: hypothetical protein J6U68_05245 [Clostridia bacterium]|nr:hypothetical protein [Clostridia bacterium]